MPEIQSSCGSHIQCPIHLPSIKGDIFDNDPAEIVELALSKLQNIGLDLVEWRALLYRRMNVPVILKDYSYLVQDDDMALASSVLSETGLPVSTPSKVSLLADGDFQSKGHLHRITRGTSTATVQHIALYPLSFSTLSLSELDKRPPSHLPSSRCGPVSVPSAPAVYASIIRMMLRYPTFCSTAYGLQSDLSELIGYHLFGLEGGYIDPDDDETWEELGVDEKIADAVRRVRTWGVDDRWREGEEWIGDALADVVAGSGKIENLPCKAKLSS